jgi:putative transposase
VLDRDENAAINILAEALRSTESSSETYACGQSSAGTVNGRCETALDEAGTTHQYGVFIPVYVVENGKATYVS